MRLHGAERDRLDSPASFDVIGVGRLAELEAVTALAAQVCDAPLTVTVVDADTQWFTSLHGADRHAVPRLASWDAVRLRTPSSPVRRRAARDPDLTDLARVVVLVCEQRRRDSTDGLLAGGVLDEARDPLRLRRALDAGELVPWCQPLVDIWTGRPHALVGLLRWQHPELGRLTADAVRLPVCDVRIA